LCFDKVYKCDTRGDAVGVHFAVLADRDIFAGHETILREVMADLVRRIRVAEGPAAASVNEMALSVVLVRP